jgi:hypothetical protein
LSTGRAIFVGHVVVSGPVLAIMIAVGVLGRVLTGSFGLGLVIGVIPAWLWWSLSVPRWRAWALARGADPAELQRIGVMTGLVWPKGWIFEKTELPPRDRDKNRGAA